MRIAAYVLSLPERLFRAGTAVLGGAVHETAAITLPRLLRCSKLYEVTAKNVLRIAIELVGRVEGAPTREPDAGAGELAVRKGLGNAVELGSIAAFGFSPLWLLAAASDVVHGSRVYLAALTVDLRAAGVVGEDVEVSSVDELLGVLERSSGRTASLIDVPPLELAELRRSVAELAGEAQELPTREELAALYGGLVATARREDRSLLEVSSGIGLALLTSARTVSRDELVVPYREDWKPLRDEGFASYARRVGRPYAEAVAGHLDPSRTSWTERALGRARKRRAAQHGPSGPGS